MSAIKAIRIHATDTDDEALQRHARIETRLEELGKAQVGLLVASGGLPTGWNPIIHAWMAGGSVGKVEAGA